MVEVSGDGPREVVEALGQAALRAVGLPEAELSVLLCDDALIRELNAKWRGVDAPTDVLSFPQVQGAPQDGDVLGDVVISMETAARHAAEVGHALADEVCVLLVHGLLHLLGHDHHATDEARKMAAEEARVLAALGLHARSLLSRAG